MKTIPHAKSHRIFHRSFLGRHSKLFLIVVAFFLLGTFAVETNVSVLSSSTGAVATAPVSKGSTVVTKAAPYAASMDKTVMNGDIGDLVWEDIDGDGIQDEGEPGVDEVTVRLFDSNDVQVDSTSTANGGFYSFANVPEGTYYIEFVKPAGYLFTAKNQGSDQTKDSDAASTGRTSEFEWTNDTDDLSRDAGLVGTYIGNQVFGDSNRDGIQDPGETGISGVTVRLLNNNDAVIATTTTGPLGEYKFLVTAAGTYSVEFVAPSGYTISPQDQGSDDTKDSDANDVPSEVLPQNWSKQRSANNPVIPLGTGDSNTVDEQYQPTAIRLDNGDIWIYVKGTARIYAFKSSDNGETFFIQNGGTPVLGPGLSGAWDDGFVLDPSAVYDAATDTIHLYYKGGHYDLSDVQSIYQSTSWGHATASGTAPTVFTKDAAPILTAPIALAALGTNNIVDMRLYNVIRIGSEFYFYGHIVTGTNYISGSDYNGRIFYAKGTGWTNPIVQGYAFPNNSDNVISNGSVNIDPMVFKQPNSPVYTMLYAAGTFVQSQSTSTRQIRVATSTDGKVWKQSSGVFLTPGANSWEAKMVYGPNILKKSSWNYVEPEFVNGKYLIYYSGLNVANQAASGLVTVVPEAPPSPATGRTKPFNVQLGQTDNTRDAGMFADGVGPFSFANSSGVTIGNSISNANPYPSNISVGGLSGIITKLTVNITGFSHPVPENVHMLLVGPAGQTFLIWSAAGGESLEAPVDITLDDDASAQLPSDNQLSSNSFRPGNHGQVNFPPPAPSGPYGNPGPAQDGIATFASVFNNSNPNGVWSLYVLNNPEEGGDGSIYAWSLNMTVGLPANPIDDSFSTNEATQFSGNVLANDVGAPAPVVTAIVGCGDHTAPFTCLTSSGGSLTLNADGSFVYTPPGGSGLTDSFTYLAANETGDGAGTATITVNPVADTPTVTAATTDEDTQTSSGLIVSRNAIDGLEVTHFKITGITNGTLFKKNGITQITNGSFITAAEGAAGLRFTPFANLFSPLTSFRFTVQASTSNADTGLGGDPGIATITVAPVAEMPSVTNAETNEDTQTTSGLVITRNGIDGAEITHFKITEITNGTLFKNDGVTTIMDGSFITAAEGAAGLKFTPNSNLFSNPGGFFGFSAAGATNSSGAGVGLAATAYVTVNRVADTPIVANVVTDEDTEATGLVVSRGTGDHAEVTHFKITGITNGVLYLNNGTTQVNNGDFIAAGEGFLGLKFRPASNLCTPSSLFSFGAQASLSNTDSGLGGQVAVATITVNPVAELPSVTSTTTNEDTQTGAGLVVTRSPIDGAEISHFRISGLTNGTLFKNDGTTQIPNGGIITAAEANAGLRFMPAANQFSPGSVFRFEVAGVRDSAGTGLGPAATATITVAPIADIPTVTDATTNEDTQSTSGLVIIRNAADGNEVTHFKITSITNGTLFKNDGTTQISNGAFITFAEGNAGLIFTPAANLFSPTAAFSFNVQAATDASGSGLSPATTATITVTPIAATPSITSATTTVNTQTTSGLVVSRNTADSNEVTHFKITNITNGTLFKNNGTTQITNNSFITFAEGNAGLRFTPSNNLASPSSTFSFQAQGATSSGGAGLGSATTATITVTCGPTVVTNTNDSGAGSLRAIINTACPGANITFNIPTSDPRFVDGVYNITLTSAELVINKNLTITGLGANLLTVRRSTAGGTPQFRIFNINAGHTVDVSGLTLTNGRAADGVANAPTGTAGQNGGAILNSGTMRTFAVLITNNRSGGGGTGTVNGGEAGSGGGIYNAGSLTLISSTVSGNQAGPGGTGGSGGFGGFGGGVYNAGTLNLVNTTINGNVSGNGGAGASGGGGNAGYGGAIANAGTLTLTSSTIAGNQTGVAGSDGGGSVGLGGGIMNLGSGTCSFANTILANNTIGSESNIAGIGFTSQDYNLIKSTAGASTFVPASHDIIGQDPNLGLLENNGGPMPTMRLLPASPAINAGNPIPPQDSFDTDNDSNTTEVLPFDQRLFARVINLRLDIGAVEVNYAISATAGSGQSAQINTAFPTHLKATVTESGNTVSGIPVTFTAPASGASGSFASSATVNTDTSGVATAPVFTANGTAGLPYNVVASLTGGSPSANFALTNLKGNQTITVNTHAPASASYNSQFTVAATASSGLAVMYSSSGTCTNVGATFTMTSGTGTCTVKYDQGGSSNYNAALQVTESVTAQKAATTTAVSSSVNPSEFGQSVTFTATVTSSAGTPTGTMQFKDGAANIESEQTLTAGVAHLTTSSLTADTHTITADYNGDVNFAISVGTLAGGQTVTSQRTLSISDVSIAEGNSGTANLVFTLTLSAASNLTVTVKYDTADGSATIADNDYRLTTGTLTFNPGDPLTKTVTVLVNGDHKTELDETVFIVLSSPVNAAFSDSQGMGTILNDDDLQLLLDTSGPEANQAAALDSLLFLRDPFPKQSIAPWLDLGSDTNTRVLIFATNLSLSVGETVTVNLVDANSQNFDVVAEDVRVVPNSDVAQIKFRLPDGIAAGLCAVRVRKGVGSFSNSGTFRITP